VSDPVPSPTPSRSTALERVNELLRSRLFGRAPHIGLIRIAEDLIHYAVALVLLAVAAIVLYRTAYDLAVSKGAFATAATNAVNGVLFAIIVMSVQNLRSIGAEESGGTRRYRRPARRVAKGAGTASDRGRHARPHARSPARRPAYRADHEDDCRSAAAASCSARHGPCVLALGMV
jgi:hypothetical protein